MDIVYSGSRAFRRALCARGAGGYAVAGGKSTMRRADGGGRGFAGRTGRAVLLPLIAWRIRRGLKEGRLAALPHLCRPRRGREQVRPLLGLHALSFVLVAAIAADLLFQLGLKEAL